MRTHAQTLWQCDLATKRMWTFRGFVDVYFLVFLHLGTRRCWISPSTVHPDSAWACQQARNFLMHAEDVQLPPKYVLRDNDAKYTSQYDEVFKSSDAVIVKNTPQSPNLRAHVERIIQTSGQITRQVPELIHDQQLRAIQLCQIPIKLESLLFLFEKIHQGRGRVESHRVSLATGRSGQGNGEMRFTGSGLSQQTDIRMMGDPFATCQFQNLLLVQ